MLSNLKLLEQPIYDLSGGTYSYGDCKKKIMKDTMIEYKNKKLKGKGDYLVKSKEQAIAIGLNKAHDECKYTKTDIEKLIDKVNEDLNNIDKDINLTNLTELRDVIMHLEKNKKSRRSYVFKSLLWNKIIKMHRDGKSLDKNMWNVINEINEI